MAVEPPSKQRRRERTCPKWAPRNRWAKARAWRPWRWDWRLRFPPRPGRSHQHTLCLARRCMRNASAFFPAHAPPPAIPPGPGRP
eukprot:scaffold27185_cov97-Isochrysis_galbana.AAC.2